MSSFRESISVEPGNPEPVNPEDKDQSPYWPTDAEMSIAYRQFTKFCSWLAVQVSRKLRMPLSNQDFLDDVSQDAMIEICKLIARYKRQFYVVGCYEWFQDNMNHIPIDRFHQVQYAMFCWRFRGQLGPKHGFKPAHDNCLARAMRHIVAPVEFRWEPLCDCRVFLESVEHLCGILNDDEKEAYDTFLNACRNGLIRPDEDVCIALNAASLKLSPLPQRPCRERPFFMDKAFHPYTKRILINWSNKLVSRRPRGDGMGYLCVDEFADMIPDLRSKASNAFICHNDSRYMMKRHDDTEVRFGSYHDDNETYEEDAQSYDDTPSEDAVRA